MLEVFGMLFPACALFVTVLFILRDSWEKEDVRVRRSLAGKLYQVDGRFVILQENGAPIMFMEGYQMPCRPISKYREIA